MTASESTFLDTLQRDTEGRIVYTVTAIDSQNRVVFSTDTHTGDVQVPLDKRSARKLAKAWKKDPCLQNVQVISRDEYGGRIEVVFP